MYRKYILPGSNLIRRFLPLIARPKTFSATFLPDRGAADDNGPRPRRHWDSDEKSSSFSAAAPSLPSFFDNVFLSTTLSPPQRRDSVHHSAAMPNIPSPPHMEQITKVRKKFQYAKSTINMCYAVLPIL
jgi:hypothetical protein